MVVSQLTFRDRKLTHTSLERALRGSRIYTKEKGWTPKSRDAGILVDLSKVEWSDLSATARLVLFIEAALREQINVKVALPTPHARGSEPACLLQFEEKRWHKSLRELRARIERRSKARDFLKYIDFELAVRCSHLELSEHQIEIIENYVPDGGDRDDMEEADPFLALGAASETDQKPEELPSHDPTYEHVLPLRWLQTPDLASIKNELDKLRGFLAGIVAGKERGILRFDAEGLANVIFHELIQNVTTHANVSHCLVAAWCRKPAQGLFADEYYAQERPFFTDWVKPNKFPLVDIVIGDSGIGITESLGGVFAKQPRPWEGVPSDVDNLTERILFWSLGRWSSRVTTEDRLLRGTRGLHRVHRLVKGYTGMLTVRSETSFVGWNHGGHEIQETFHESGLPRVPGTTLSIRLPVIMKAEGPIHSPPIKDRLLDFTVVKPLDITRDGLSKEAQNDLSEKLSRVSADRHRCVVAIVRDIPDAPEERKIALGKAFEQLKILSTPGALAVLAPGISADDLDVHVDSFTQVTDEAVLKSKLESRQKNSLGIGAYPDYYNITDLFCVIDFNLNTLWTGGNINEVRLLNAIQRSAESTATDEEIQKMFPRADERHEVIGDLKGQPDLFRFHQDGSISLRFNTSDVFNYVKDYVSHRLDDTLDDPLQIGIETDGPFLSPSLIYVKKWLTMNRVLRDFGWFWVTGDLITRLHSVATKKDLAVVEQEQERAFASFQQLCAFLQDHASRGDLAKLSRERLAKASHIPFGSYFVIWALAATITKTPFYRPDRILCDSLVHEGGAEQLARFLGIPEQYTIMPRLSLLGELPELWGDFTEKRVLVFCDMLLSGNSPRQVLEQAIRQGAKPTAIACIFDFRTEQSDYLEFAGIRIPVVSLLHTSRMVIPHHPRFFRYIDAVSGKPETESDEFSKNLSYPMNRDVMDDYINRTSALYFNHIIRPARHGSFYHQYEHFTFFLDADRFFSNEDCLETTQRILLKEINNFLEEQESPDTKTRLLYVSNDEVEGDRAKDLLRLAHSTNSQPPPTSIRRWGFPENISVKDRNVVIVDWNAETGRTISRLMYLAAARGANSVLGVVWTSRMSDEEEQVLRSIDRMRIPELSSAPDLSAQDNLFSALADRAADNQRTRKPNTWRTVPVRVVFLSQARVHQCIESDCPICTQRERVMGERGELSRFPTQHLRNFVSRQMDGFRAKLINEVRRSEHIRNEDCFGAPLTSAKTSLMFRFRENLDQAMHSTRFRALVAQHVKDVHTALAEGAAPAISEAEAMVCLLATELQWFKLPPLHFYELREVLAQIAYKILSSNPEGVAAPHALIVMRSAQKVSFSKAIAQLTPRLLERPNMLMQILYDAFTMIDAPYHDKFTLTPLVNSLSTFVDTVAKHREVAPDDHLEVHAAAQAVLGLGVRRLGFATSEESNLLSAWNSAKQFINRELSDSHSTLGMVHKRFQFGAVEQSWEKLRQPINDASAWDVARIKWSEGQNVLERNFFRHVRTCWQIFEGPRAELDFDDADREFLKDICLNLNSERIARINDLLSEFSVNAPSPGTSWTEFKSVRTLLFRLLLKVGNTPNDSGGVRKFMASCPVDIIEVIEQTKAKAAWPSDIRPEFQDSSFTNLLVFCHRSIVEDVIEELLDNAAVHKPPSSVEARLRISIEHDPANDVVKLLFLYSGTDPDYRNPELPGEGKQGLRKLEKALEPYNAQIKSGPKAGPDWSYNATVKFRFGGVSSA